MPVAPEKLTDETLAALPYLNSELTLEKAKLATGDVLYGTQSAFLARHARGRGVSALVYRVALLPAEWAVA